MNGTNVSLVTHAKAGGHGAIYLNPGLRGNDTL